MSIALMGTGGCNITRREGHIFCVNFEDSLGVGFGFPRNSAGSGEGGVALESVV